MTQHHSEQSVVVRFAGRAEEIASGHAIEVRVRGNTPSEIIAGLAEANPLLRNLIVHPDGTPKSSVRVVEEREIQDLDIPIAGTGGQSEAVVVRRRIIIVIVGCATKVQSGG